MKRQATMRQHGRLMALLWYVALPGKWRTRLDLGAITLVSTGVQAQAAAAALLQAPLWGFDTESKPTFHVG